MDPCMAWIIPLNHSRTYLDEWDLLCQRCIDLILDSLLRLFLFSCYPRLLSFPALLSRYGLCCCCLLLVPFKSSLSVSDCARISLVLRLLQLCLP